MSHAEYRQRILASLKHDLAEERQSVRQYGRQMQEARETGHASLASNLAKIREDEKKHRLTLVRAVRQGEDGTGPSVSE